VKSFGFRRSPLRHANRRVKTAWRKARANKWRRVARVDMGRAAATMGHDVGVARDLASRAENRENGANPLRSRRCNRGRTPQITTVSYCEAGRCG
jgi:hypothetical protein